LLDESDYHAAEVGGLLEIHEVAHILEDHATRAGYSRFNSTCVSMDVRNIGSTRAGILRLVLMEGFKLVAMGFVLGIVAAAFLQKAVAKQTYGVQPYDPLVLAGVIALLASIALIACAVPVRRAMGVDPVVVLRYE
jgi:FtsX-like permease family protein